MMAITVTHETPQLAMHVGDARTHTHAGTAQRTAAATPMSLHPILQCFPLRVRPINAR